MIDNRLFIWQLLTLVFILIQPLFRKIMSMRTITIGDGYLRPFILSAVLSAVIQVLFFSEIIASTEFLYLQLIIVLYFISSGFNHSVLSAESEPVKISSINKTILQKISKAFGGGNVEAESNMLIFSLSTPYRLKFDATARVIEGEGRFSFTARNENLRVQKLVMIVSFYLITTAVVEGTENVKFPFLATDVSAVLASIIGVSIVIILNFAESNAISTFSTEFPIFYKKALQSAALDSILPEGTKTTGKSGFSTTKDKAKALIEKRDINVLKAKREEIKNKIQSVFGMEEEDSKLDPKAIERVRLMSAVKRILNSTPPWMTVSLEQITKKVKGKTAEVEIIISGLRSLNEVKGIYDIWNKEYHGASMSQWLQTQSVVEAISKNDLGDNIQSVKIYPDGSSELYLKEKED